MSASSIRAHVGKKSIQIFDVVVFAILSLWALVIFIPFYNLVMISISTQAESVSTPFMIFPKKPTLDSYIALFQDGRIWIGYKTTVSILALGLPINMVLTTTLAYALSKDSFPGKKAILFIILFTMFFSGGIIPLYLLVKSLNLTNKLIGVVLVSGTSTFNMIIMRNYFQSLPAAMGESARIDGAGEWTIMLRIILPLSAPIIATVALFFAVDRWNEWFNAMIFIRDTNKTPLQLVLRSIGLEASMIGEQGMASEVASQATNRYAKAMKMAAVAVTLLPVMCVYPFLQKHFVKGVMIGAIKA